MASRSRKIRAGLFIVAAAALAAIGLLAFGGMRLVERGDDYQVEYEGSVYGLQEGASVYLSGVRVGSVEGLTVSPIDPSRVRVHIRVKRGTPVRTDTRAVLQFAGITGLKVIDLRDGTIAAPPLPPGSTIAAGETILDKLERRAEDLAAQTTALMERSNRILANVETLTDPQGELAQGARRGIAEIATAGSEIAAAGATLRTIVAENRAGVRRSVDAVGRVATSADEVVGQLQGLLRENGGVLRSTMFDLRQASRSLKDLAREVRQRPSRLLFSGAQPDRRMP
ncbi:MAG TPA: MlaD family protein [Kofleriaceae bacterium]|nr:MlaD family protein [Kofleriaceae bacterium]